MGSVRRLILLSLSLTALMASAIILWLPNSNLSIGPENFVAFGQIVAALVALYLLSLFVLRRVAHDPSAPAAWIKKISGVLQTILVVAAILAPFMFATSVLMYLGSATASPLVDADLAAIDAALGLDWVATVSWLNQSPTVSAILMRCYYSVALQMAAVLLFLSVIDRVKALEFTAIICLTIFLTELTMAAFPSAGAYYFYRPDPSIYSNFTGAGGLLHLHELMALRSGQPFALTVSTGLISFPSFHTALGIMIVYAVRKWIFLLIPAVVVNAIMIVATIPEGGHHLSDIIAGAAVTVMAIFAVRSVLAYRSAPAASPVQVS